MTNTLSSVQLVYPDPPFWTKTACIQLGYGLWVNLSGVGIGLALGFSAVAIPQLKEAGSPIIITIKEEALIASVLTLSAPIGNCLSGIIMDRFGCKIALVLCEIPLIFGWFYMGFAASAKHIIVGRAITGIGMGMKMMAPRAYITKITRPNMRGVIGALPNLTTSIGLITQATLGSYLSWKYLCYICGAYALILMFGYILLPDTPYSILLKSTASKARNVLKKFRSEKFNIDGEINELNDFKEVNDIRRLGPWETIKALLTPSSCKPFSIILFYVILVQMVGCNVVIMWAVEMLQDSKSSIDPHLGNIMLAVTRIVVGVIISILLYKVPRRVLALVSAIGLGVICISLGYYLNTHKEESPYPLVFFIGYITLATLGYYTLPFMMMFEILPLQVRGILSGIVFSIMSLTMFGVNQVYPIMRKELGLGYTIIVYGAISLCGAVVLYFILPETKDLTLQEIEEYFNDIRSTLVSQRQVMSMQLLSKTTLSKYTRSRSHGRLPHWSDNNLHRIYENEHDKNKKHGKGTGHDKSIVKDKGKERDKDKDHDKEKKHDEDFKQKHDKTFNKHSSSVVFKDSSEDDKSKG